MGLEYLLRDREVLGSNPLVQATPKTLIMVPTANLCDAPHIKSLSKGKTRVPDYVADSSVPILDRGRNAIEKEIGSSIMFFAHVSTTVKLLNLLL